MQFLSNRYKLLSIILLIFLVSITSIYYSRVTTVFSYYGSRGNEVIEIQIKLKNWGYYSGIVDGNYGYKTFTAVKYFQSKNNLSVDGVCGSSTLSALGINTSPSVAVSRSDSTYSRNIDLLSRLINGEARGEPYTGQVAVGAVILNRVRDSRFPSTIPGVVYQPGAFDAVEDGQINLPPNSSCIKAAHDAVNGWDPSKGSVYYFNPNTATSKWIWTRTIVAIIGKHYFAK